MTDESGRQRESGMTDASLVQLCREMTPVQRLEAAVRLSEATFQFYLAGVEHRRTLRPDSVSREASKR